MGQERGGQRVFGHSSRTGILEFGLIGLLVSLMHCLDSVVVSGGAVRIEKDTGPEKSLSFAQVSGRLGPSHSLPWFRVNPTPP